MPHLEIAPNRRCLLVARVFATLAWMWLGIAIPFLTDLGCDFTVGLALKGTWMCVAFLGFIGFLGLSSTALPTGYIFRNALSAAVALGLGAVLTLTPVGVWARFKLCEPWLDRYADALPAGTDKKLQNEYIGLFQASHALEQNGIVFLYAKNRPWLDEIGLARIPPGTPLPDRVYVKSHLSGDWYIFVQRY